MNRMLYLGAGALAFTLAGLSASTAGQPASLSPSWQLSMPKGPDATVKITEAYARMVAREAYFWAWPWSTSTIGGSPSRKRRRRAS
ncbi:Hypothetical protein NGAL_HAMBI2566_03950 [Neorhizobium galegae bv. orientalis]|nr:Hypothetical protein NGAL_HAMBI2566_03950 [Neorhizobium galegae bv. orientalis]